MDKQYETIVVKATEIRRGDRLMGRLGEPIAKKVDIKVKWVYVIDEDDKTWEFPKDQIAVLVMRETQASKTARIEAEHRTYRNEKIEQWVAKYEERSHTKKAQAKINEILSNEGALVDDWNMRGLIEAQAADKVAARVHHALEFFLSKQAEGEPVAKDLVEMAEKIADDYKDKMFSGYNMGLSRSTSVVENVMVDADRQAEAAYVKDVYRFFNAF